MFSLKKTFHLEKIKENLYIIYKNIVLLSYSQQKRGKTKIKSTKKILKNKKIDKLSVYSTRGIWN